MNGALGVTLFGALTFVIPDRFNSLAVRVGHYLVLVVPGLLLLVWSVPRLFNLFSARHSLRVLPICVGGLVFGAYFALGFMPELSRHLSPRDVFETYNTLRGPDEVLGEFQAGGRAGGYYTDGEVRTLESLDRVVSFLTEAGDTRVWAVFPADQLVEVNQRYRTQTQEHLFVADARNARMLLATNQPIEGRDNENVIARSVLRELPRPPQHPMNVSFGGKVELIGYDLELPAGESVGPSQSFAVTWYWRALQPNIGGYKIFLHIDGHGKRLNGDHDPVEERYPVSRWQAGDIVLDRQELDVGADYPPGNYTMWIGFYAGSSRLPLTELSACTVNQRERCKDTANRLNAGQLVVR